MGRVQSKKTLRVKPVRGVTITSDSSYQVAFTYRGQLCRERYTLEPSDANTKWVNRKKEDIEEMLTKDEFNYEDFFPDSKRVLEFASDPAKLITVKEYFTDWVNNNKQFFKSSGYVTTKRIINSHVIPKLGHLKLSDLNNLVVDDWLAGMDVSHKTKKNRLSALRSPLSDVPKHILSANPIKDYEHKKPRQVLNLDTAKVETIDALDHVERDLLLSVLSGQDYNYVLFNMWTGLRPSEMIALQWDDIDWVKGRVRVERCRTEATPRGKFEPPKTKAGIRDVPLCEFALDALKAQKEHTLLAGKEVFTNMGKPWNSPADINKAFWIKALKKAGIRHRTPYQLRHTFASIMLMGCETTQDEEKVSKAMGHTTVAFTRKTYYSFLERDDDSNIIGKIGQSWKAKKDDKRL